MAEVLSYCFFNDLSNAAFCLSPTLRSCVRRGRISPPPAGCVTIGAPALRGLTSIICSPSSSRPKIRKFWFWTDPWRHQWPQSQILTLFGEFTSAGLSNSVWKLEIGPVVWKISGGPFASPIRTCCHPAPSWRGLKAAVSFHHFAKKKSHWFQQWNLLPMPTNQPFTSTETVSVRQSPHACICTVLDKSIRRFGAPSRFLAISPKQMQISTPNFEHPLSHAFHTLRIFFWNSRVW